MPAPMFGYSMSRYADRRSREAEAERSEPLPPGVDPLEALDPELRALVTSTGPAPDGARDPDTVVLADRLRAALVGAALGAALGAIVINVGTTSRRQSFTASAAPMDRTHTLAAAGFGAAIGAISGFARGHSPLEQAPVRRSDHAPPDMPPPAAAAPGMPSHPAFAQLHVPASG